MGASKFNHSTVEVILKIISETNSEQSAWEAAGISKSTYYGWRKKYENFEKSVQQARSDFLERNYNVFRVLAINCLYDALTVGVVQTKTTTVKELVTVPSTNGEPPKSKLTTTKTTTVESNLGVPTWAVERVLGRTMDEIDAVNKLIESGWFDPKLVSELPPEMDLFNDKVRDILSRNAIK